MSATVNRTLFKEWLIQRVMGLRVGYGQDDPKEVEATSREMGVRPDVLREARRRNIEGRKREGRGKCLGIKRAQSDHYQIELWVPEEVWPLWEQEHERRGLKGSALLRSMIHTYLLGSWEPPGMSSQWVLNGKGYDLNLREWQKQHTGKYPYRERALIPLGAARALRQRATRQGTTVSAITRALITNAIEGRWGQPGTFPIVDSSAMYEDERRYFLG